MVNEFLPLLYSFHFYLFGLIAVAASIAFVTRKSPVSAALWLVVVMFCLAALYVMMDAQFVGVMQVLVYAGAIMVVFVFVVMLLNLGDSGGLDIAPWADRVQLVTAMCSGPWELPVLGQVSAPTAVLIRPDGYILI